MNIWQVLLRATEPAALVSGGVVAAAALAIGAPILAVPVLGAGAVAGVAALRARDTTPAARRSEGRPEIKLAPHWQAHVIEAEDSHRRYLLAAAGIDDPNLRDELDRIGRRLEDGVDTMRRVAERGQQLDLAIGAMPEPADLRRQMTTLRERGIGHDDARWTALAYQLDTAERVRGQRDDVLARLDTLDAQLDAAVVHAIETGLQADHTGVQVVGDAVESALTDLDGLNRALGEISGIA